MSLMLDFGPHTVVIYPEETVVDSRGNVIRRPSATGVTITGCLMTPLASTRGAFAAISVEQGQRVDAAWRLFARNAPLGWWSRVEFEGKNMTVLGGPLVFTTSDGTRHISATLTEER
jgi:hypothetical protein